MTTSTTTRNVTESEFNQLADAVATYKANERTITNMGVSKEQYLAVAMENQTPAAIAEQSVSDKIAAEYNGNVAMIEGMGITREQYVRTAQRRELEKRGIDPALLCLDK